MRIRVRLFAMHRAQTGRREHLLELPEGSDVGAAWERLVADLPVIAGAAASVRFARNGAYVPIDEPLADGDELAVIPPVAGGSGADREARAARDDRAARDRAAPDDMAIREDRVARDDAAIRDDPLTRDEGADFEGSLEAEVDVGRFRRIELADAPLEDSLLGELRRQVATRADGAVAIFLGQTRVSPGTPAPGQEAEAERFTGQPVESLAYEAFESMTLTMLERIADEIEARFGVRRLAIVHRLGEVALGEASVVIAAAAPHREAAFEACRYAIEELKARAPIWKAERFANGSVWMGAPARDAPGPG